MGCESEALMPNLSLQLTCCGLRPSHAAELKRCAWSVGARPAAPWRDRGGHSGHSRAARGRRSTRWPGTGRRRPAWARCAPAALPLPLGEWLRARGASWSKELDAKVTRWQTPPWCLPIGSMNCLRGWQVSVSRKPSPELSGKQADAAQRRPSSKRQPVCIGGTPSLRLPNTMPARRTFRARQALSLRSFRNRAIFAGRRSAS